VRRPRRRDFAAPRQLLEVRGELPLAAIGEYGHQRGELNFIWLPLTDPKLTRTTLWVESHEGAADDAPLDVGYGEVAAFHGSVCSHHVPANESRHTRVSLDFRVGVEGFFDPHCGA